MPLLAITFSLYNDAKNVGPARLGCHRPVTTEFPLERSPYNEENLSVDNASFVTAETLRPAKSPLLFSNGGVLPKKIASFNLRVERKLESKFVNQEKLSIV